jgi:hypothetical protein
VKKQARAKRLWHPLKAWRPHEWVSMVDALERVEKTVGTLQLARHALRQDLLKKRLVAAVWVIAQDGTETWMIADPTVWQSLRIWFGWQIRSEGEVEGYDPYRRKWHFFVRRRDLDKRYPAAAAAMPSESSSTTKSKPGSADAWIDHVCPNGEWRLMTAKDIHKKILPEAKALGVKAPSYSAVAAALLNRPT